MVSLEVRYNGYRCKLPVLREDRAQIFSMPDRKHLTVTTAPQPAALDEQVQLKAFELELGVLANIVGDV